MSYMTPSTVFPTSPPDSSSNTPSPITCIPLKPLPKSIMGYPSTFVFITRLSCTPTLNGANSLFQIYILPPNSMSESSPQVRNLSSRHLFLSVTIILAIATFIPFTLYHAATTFLFRNFSKSCFICKKFFFWSI